MYSLKLNKITILFAANSTLCGWLPIPVLQISWSSLEKMRVTKWLKNRSMQPRKVLLIKVGWHVMSN